MSWISSIQKYNVIYVSWNLLWKYVKPILSDKYNKPDDNKNTLKFYWLTERITYMIEFAFSMNNLYFL